MYATLAQLRVSIHAFRGEGDDPEPYVAMVTVRFNPRLPGGRRHARIQPQQPAFDVSIHAFRGEGDRRVDVPATRDGVSIHAFRGEGDRAG